MLGEKACPVLLVTSGVPGEGKTLVAAHLAKAYARAGKKTLLVGCDLRNPQLHSYLHKDYSRGLSAYLAGMEPEWRTAGTFARRKFKRVVWGRCPAEPGSFAFK